MQRGSECEFHSQGKKIMFCFNLQCKAQRKLCPACVEDFHSNHRADVISLYPLAKFSKMNRLSIHSQASKAKMTKIIIKNIREYKQLAFNFSQKITVACEEIIQTVQKIVIDPCIALQECFEIDTQQKIATRILDQSITKEELDFISLCIHKFSQQQFSNMRILQEIVRLSMDNFYKNIDFLKSMIQKFQSKVKKWGLFEATNWREKISKEKQKLQKQYTQEQKIKRLLQASKKKIKELVTNQKDYTKKPSLRQQNIQMLRNKLSCWGKFIEDSQGKKWSLNEWEDVGKNISDIQIVNLMNRKLEQFPNQFKQIPNLKCLYLDNNKLTTTSQLEDFLHLQMLSITNNCLEDINGLKKLLKLKTAYIYNNHLSAEVIEEIKQLNKKKYTFYFTLKDSL